MIKSAHGTKLLWFHIVWEFGTPLHVSNFSFTCYSLNPVTLCYYYVLFTKYKCPNPYSLFTVTTDTDLEVCELDLIPLSFSVMCAVDSAAELTAVTHHLKVLFRVRKQYDLSPTLMLLDSQYWMWPTHLEWMLEIRLVSFAELTINLEASLEVTLSVWM